jgi:hypothetical protein
MVHLESCPPAEDAFDSGREELGLVELGVGGRDRHLAHLQTSELRNL